MNFDNHSPSAPRPSNTNAEVRPRGLVTRRPRPMALEQRFMFDGAAVIEAVAVVNGSPPEPTPPPSEPVPVVSEPVASAPANTSTARVDQVQEVNEPTAVEPESTATAPAPTEVVAGPVAVGPDAVDPEPAGPATADTDAADPAAPTEGTGEPTPSLNFEPPADAPNPDVLNQGIAQADAALATFALQDGAALQLFTVFSGGQSEPSVPWTAHAENLLDHLHSGGAPVTVALLDHGAMNGLFGAYAAPTAESAGVIYINADWLATQTDADAVTRVLLEEMGHAIDHELNGNTDTAGDEGEWFALTLLGRTPAGAQAERIAAENDAATLDINGQTVAVEAASLSFSAVFQGTPSAPSEEAQSLNDITPLAGSGFSFVSANPADVYFSGNNVVGYLNYTDANGDPQSIYGVASRLFKTGNTIDGIYFYAPGADGLIGTGDAGEGAYLLQVNPVFVIGSDNGTSSDPVHAAVNDLLVSYEAPTAYADTSDTPGAQAAQEVGLVEPGQDATGNVLANDTGNGDASVQSVGTASATQPVTSGSTSANLSGGTAVAGSHGTLYIAADGSYRYELNDSDPVVEALRLSTDTLTERFTYQMVDSEGHTSTASLTITVQGANDAPVAVNDTNSGKESLLTSGTQYTASDLLGRTAEGNVLDNDTDPDRSGETAEIDGLYASGAYLSHFLGASVTNLTFSPTASTLQNVGTSHYVYVQTGSNYTLLTSGGTPVRVTGNVTQPDGSYSLSLSGTPTNYTLSNNSQVAFSTSGNATVTNSGSTRTATVGATESVVTSTVTVTQTSGTIQAGMAISGTGIPVGTRVTAVTDDGAGNLTLSLDQQLTTAPSGSFTLSAAAGATLTGQYGSLVLNADGSYVYTPFANNPDLAPGATGVDSFQYTMRDAAGVASLATLSITVTGSATTDPNAVNDSANATEAGGAANTGGTNATGTVISNDTTPTGTISVVGARAVGDPGESAIGAGSYTTLTGQYGSLQLWSNGSYVYTADNSLADVQALNVGDTLEDTFQYHIRNTASPAGEDIATLTITLQGANDNPVAVNDSLTGVEDTPRTITAAELLGNDVDVDNPSLSILGVGNAIGGQVVLNGDGSLSFTPDAHFQGTASFTYTASDGLATSGATVTLAIAAVNDAPTAADNTFATVRNTPLTGVNLISNNDPSDGQDADVDGDALTVSKVNGLLFTANSSSVEFPSADGWMEVVLAHGSLFVQQDGSMAYQPLADDLAGDSFSYVATDGADESVAATVRLNVNEPGNAPAVIGGDDGGSVTEDASSPTLQDTGTLTVSDINPGEALFLTGPGGVTTSPLTLGSLSMAADGEWTYSVDNALVQHLAAGDTLAETFTVRTVDGTQHTVTVTVQGTNDVPLPGDTSDPSWNSATGQYEVSTPEDTARTGTIEATDLDLDTLSFAEQTSPTHGSLLLDPATGDWSYTPDAEYVGSDSFVVTVADGQGGTVDVTVLVTITPVNDPPVVGDTSDPSWNSATGQYEVSTPEDTARTGSIEATDLDLDTLSFAEQTSPTHGSLLLDPATGDWSYTPAPGYHGTDSFVVQVSDQRGGVALVTVQVQVVPAPQPAPTPTPTPEPPPAPAPAPAPAAPAPAATPAPAAAPAPEPASPPSPSVAALAPAPAEQASTPASPPPPTETLVDLPAPLRFDAALPSVGSARAAPWAANALDWLQPVSTTFESESHTRPSGFPVPVDTAAERGLNLNREVTDQFVQNGATSTITLPFDTFVHSDAQATVTLSARLADGKALPGWIAFDPRTGAFSVTPPPGVDGEMDILVSARDDRGNEVSTKFTVHVGKAVQPAGRAGLSEQFRREARQDMPWTQRMSNRDPTTPTAPRPAPTATRAPG